MNLHFLKKEFQKIKNDNETMDEEVEAVCECGKYTKIVTFRNLKNKWPRCECKLSMKVRSNAVPFI